jgi:hypothetical protein
MHPLLQTMLLTVLVPAAIAGAVLLLASWFSPGRWRDGLTAAGLAAAWCAGVMATVRWPQWPPMQAADGQFYGVVTVGVLALVSPWWKQPLRGRWLAGLVLASLFFVLLLHRLWHPPMLLWGPLLMGGGVLLSAVAIERVGRYNQAAWTFFALTVYAVMVSTALMLGGSATLGHKAGLLAAACGAMCVVSVVWRRQLCLAQTGLVAAVLLGGLLAQSVFLSEMPRPAALLLAMAWWPAAVASWLLRHGSGQVRAVIVTLMFIAPCVAALILLQRG